MTRQRFDVIVAGAGEIGRALALALSKASDGALRVALIGPPSPATRERAYLLSPSARFFLDRLDLWPRLTDVAQTVSEIVVTDTAVRETVRPAWMTFHAEDAPGRALAFGVPSLALDDALREALHASPVTRIDAGVAIFKRKNDAVVEVVTDEGALYETRLLCVCDGARSKLRTQARIPFYGGAHGQTALVATLTHSLPHRGRAVQHFFEDGPFALLPLQGKTSCLTWSCDAKTAEAFLALPQDAKKDVLERRAAGWIGRLSSIGDVVAFPLFFGIARRFAQERLALLGDAAHKIHPIAGQGINLGFRSAAALCDALIDALSLGLDIGAESTLTAYEKSHRPAALEMAAMTQACLCAFSAKAQPWPSLRALGAEWIEKTGIKSALRARAFGSDPRAPRWFRPA